MEIKELDEKLKSLQNEDIDNEPLLEYVTFVAQEYTPVMRFELIDNEKYPSNHYRNAEFEFPKNNAGTYTFVDRYFQGEIDTSFKGRFLENKELQKTLKAMMFDVSKFWYLLLFVKDITDDLCSGGELLSTPRENLKKFLDRLNEYGFYGGETGIQRKKEGEGVSIHVKGRHQDADITDAPTLFCLREAIKRLLVSPLTENDIWTKWLKVTLNSSEDINNQPDEVPKLYKFKKFYTMMEYFITANKRKNKDNKDSTVSTDKYLLVS